MDRYIKDPVIDIGGEKYILHTLGITEFGEYMAMIRSNQRLREFLDGFKDSPMLVGEPVFTAVNHKKYCLDFFIQVVNSFLQPGNRIRVARIDSEKGFKSELTEGGYVCWMPALIPLDKNGKSLQKQFQHDNPDGTIISSLYFMMCDHAHSLNRMGWKTPMLPQSMANTDLSFIEAGFGSEHMPPIDWVVFRGMLVPRRGLINVPLDKLYERELLPKVVISEA